MKVKEFLNIVCGEIKYKPVRNGIAEELETHIQDIKEEYMEKGIEEQQAEEKAVLQMGNAEEIGKKLNKIHKPKLDWKLLILVIVLIAFGILVAVLKQININDSSLGETIIYMLFSVAIGIGVYFFDYRKIKKYSSLIYIVATLIMILPLFFKSYINGIPYLKIFSISIFTPTITLLLYLISFIGYITNYNKDNNLEINIVKRRIKLNKDFIKIIVLSILSLLLMMVVPSTSNAIILGIAYIVIATIKLLQNKKENTKKLIGLYGSILAISIVIFFCIISSPFRFQRIIASFNPEVAPDGAGWVGMLQKEVLENAKMIGEAETVNSKNILMNVGCEYSFIYLLGKTGIVVTSILVIAIILMSIKLIINARNIKEQYGKFLIVGLSTLFILQSFANILMNVNMWIVSDVSLPFVTYGGVYFVINSISIAIILSVYRKKDVYQYEMKDNIETNKI